MSLLTLAKIKCENGRILHGTLLSHKYTRELPNYSNKLVGNLDMKGISSFKNLELLKTILVHIGNNIRTYNLGTLCTRLVFLRIINSKHSLHSELSNYHIANLNFKVKFFYTDTAQFTALS